MENRCLLSVVGLGSLPDVTMAAGTTMFIPLNATDPGQTVNFTVQSSDTSQLTPTITPQTNKTLQLNVVVNGVTQTMDFQLFDNLAPNTTAQIEQLVNSGFYNGLQIYRNGMDGSGNPFVIQGGNDPPTGAIKTDQSSMAEEFNPDLQYTSAGMLAMARTGKPGSSSTEFFITEEAARSLDFNYTLFGLQTTGQSVDQAIAAMADENSTQDPQGLGYLVDPITISSASIVTDTQNGVLELRASGSHGPSHGDGDCQRRHQYADARVVHRDASARFHVEPDQSLCLGDSRRPERFDVFVSQRGDRPVDQPGQFDERQDPAVPGLWRHQR